MSNEETVQVPVDLLERIVKADALPWEEHEEVTALIPKPKPRLVAVDLDKVFTEQSFGVSVVTLDLLSDQPDLLTLLDSVAEGLKDRGWLDDLGVQNMMVDCRTALGVDE